MRLFIAINFPDAMRLRLCNEAAPLRDAGYPVKWVAADHVHMTVKFLGEVDESRADATEDGLRHAVGDTKTFTLPVGQFGAFPSAKRPRVDLMASQELTLFALAPVPERHIDEGHNRGYGPDVLHGLEDTHQPWFVVAAGGH